MRKLQSQGVHHITLVGVDRQTSIDFWEGVLGMPFVFEQPNLDNAAESHLYFDPGDGRLITAIVRGDHEFNETKLSNAVDASTGIRPATVEEIRAAGMEPGYGSPIGARNTTVVVDDLVARSPNLVAGANREGFHYRNVNAGRDFTPDIVTDLTNAQEGDPCPTCGSPPAMAQMIGAITENVRLRLLSCGLCGTRWKYARTKCPFCESDSQRLDSVVVEGEAGLRIDYCEACGGYLKTYDGQGEELLLLSDWTSLHLDLLAHDRGWKRLAGSLYELDSSLHP